MSDDYIGGANAGEVAAPLETDVESEALETPEVTTDEGGTDQISQTEVGEDEVVSRPGKPGRDSVIAEYRRRAEAAERELKARDEWVRRNWGQYGITTWEQYQLAVQQSMQQQMEDYKRQREAELAEQGYDINAIREIMKTDPEYQRLAQENMTIKEELMKTKAERELQNDYAKLREKYGELVPADFKSFVASLSEEVFDLVRQGMPLRSAWKEVNEDKILEWAQTRAKQKTIRNITSKAHLDTEKSTGTDPSNQVSIPEEQLAVWKKLGYSEAEARKRVAKYMAKQKSK